MSHVMYYFTDCILDRASHTEETMSDFFAKLWIPINGHDGVASGYPTPTGFGGLTGCQRDP